jgi:hypothetical protein
MTTKKTLARRVKKLETRAAGGLYDWDDFVDYVNETHIGIAALPQKASQIGKILVQLQKHGLPSFDKKPALLKAAYSALEAMHEALEDLNAAAKSLNNVAKKVR